ncbi:MAG: iron-sulfur cluster assembly accessory protein [Thermoanaerobaculia bacterium]
MASLDKASTEPAQTPALDAAAEYPVTLTKKAVDMIKISREQEGLEPSCGLRIAVRGGGCSGFEYALDFEDENRDTDLVYLQGDLQVIVDPISARYLQGTEIDYTLGMSGTGFKFNNPKAVGTCGCGSSFAV